MLHRVERGFVIRPELALFYNFSDIEPAYKEHLETVAGKFYKWRMGMCSGKTYYYYGLIYHCRPQFSLCTYAKYTDYCEKKLEKKVPYHTLDLRNVHVSEVSCEKCREGFGGRHCHFDINECTSYQPQYTSSHHVTQYEDEFVITYKQVKTEPLPHKCSENSSCENTFGSYKCICHAGWTGKYCRKDIDECNTGVHKCGQMTIMCANTIGGYKCICKNGFTGQLCTNDVEECKQSLCHNNATCKDTYGSYFCICPAGWTGQHCDQDINECNQNPCDNEGTCLNTHGSYMCQCTEYFTGHRCHIEIDACKTLQCKHGYCAGKRQNATCKCYGDWFGVQCNYSTDKCQKKDTCMNGGTCENDHLMNFTCHCRKGFTGINCEIDKNDCLSKPCANGWCVDLPSGYKCICPPDVHGVNCNTSESKCAHLHCATGTCKIRRGMPYCHCDDEHYGKHCEIERDPCASLPCRGLSTCINDFKKKQFECICPPKFEGVYCSEKKVFCHSNTCLNNGTCLESDSPLGYMCSCKTEAFGARCENDINATSGQSKRPLLHYCLIVLTIWKWVEKKFLEKNQLNTLLPMTVVGHFLHTGF
uniref:EGF-like domain-containing protein n=1 Tax=Trichuris muris TaxID=70415 RepID=A0A5S6QF26_TRIMR